MFSQTRPDALGGFRRELCPCRARGTAHIACTRLASRGLCSCYVPLQQQLASRGLCCCCVPLRQGDASERAPSLRFICRREWKLERTVARQPPPPPGPLAPDHNLTPWPCWSDARIQIRRLKRPNGVKCLSVGDQPSSNSERSPADRESEELSELCRSSVEGAQTTAARCTDRLAGGVRSEAGGLGENAARAPFRTASSNCAAAAAASQLQQQQHVLLHGRARAVPAAAHSRREEASSGTSPPQSVAGHSWEKRRAVEQLSSSAFLQSFHSVGPKSYHCLILPAKPTRKKEQILLSILNAEYTAVWQECIWRTALQRTVV
ncbi:unnamed protein product [Lampetra fluviatilis]